MSTNLSTTLALSAAALFLTACTKGQPDTAPPGSEASADTKIKCLGINECKGQGACDMPTHSCAGQNECKGKGWIVTTSSECDAQGGTPKA